MRSSLQTVWENQTGHAFWAVLALLAVFVVLLGAKVIFQQTQQQRKERQDKHRNG